ncbi:MAG TPA: heat shock protein HspQ [Aliidongia sp.]|nr:heat shock protein HspQ [Aliidongia sp.]
MASNSAKFGLGQIVRHRKHPFRGVVIDIDPAYSNGDEWYERIATNRPRKDQPWYHLLAESADKSYYTAYVSEQNLLPDETAQPIKHPDIDEYFTETSAGGYRSRRMMN